MPKRASAAPEKPEYPAIENQSDGLATEIIARWEAMRSDRKNWDLRWDECARYIMPRKGNILTKYTPGQDITFNIYDTTATEAAYVFAAGCLTHITPAGEKWVRCEPKSGGKVQPSTQLREWFDELSEVVINLIYESNFYVGAHEDWLDAGIFCSSLMFLEEGKQHVLNFVQIPVGTFAWAESAEGIVDTVAREFKWTARQAQQEWGLEKLGPQLKAALASRNPADWARQFTFLHFVEPRKDAGYKGGPVVAERRPIRSLYICVEDCAVIEEGGYYEMPYFGYRLLRSNNETYGRGPGMDSLPEIKLVNAMERDLLTAVEKLVNPPWLAGSDADFDLDQRPNGITYWDTSDEKNKPAQLQLNNQVDLGEKKTDQKRERIRRAFYNDMFKMLTNMEEQKREKTAYEVQQMVSEKLILFSPLFARYVQEKLNPMIERVVGIALREGLVSPPPPEIRRGGVQYEIVLTSKIALAIKAAENQAFATMMALVEQMQQFDPSVPMVIKWREALRRISRNVGNPAKLLRSDAEVDKMFAEQQKQAQAAQAAQTMELMSRSAKNLGPGAQQQVAEAMPQSAGGRT